MFHQLIWGYPICTEEMEHPVILLHLIMIRYFTFTAHPSCIGAMLGKHFGTVNWYIFWLGKSSRTPQTTTTSYHGKNPMVSCTISSQSPSIFHQKQAMSQPPLSWIIACTTKIGDMWCPQPWIWGVAGHAQPASPGSSSGRFRDQTLHADGLWGADVGVIIFVAEKCL